MSSPPPDRGTKPDTALFEGDPDADTGPVFVVRPNGEETAETHAPNSTMVAPIPAEESYASRFTAPLTVDPRATKVKSLGIQPAKVLAIVGALVLVAALVFLLFHVFDDVSSDADGESITAATAQPADQDKLQGILPQGYVAGSCTPAELSKGALAKVSCTANADAGGPPNANYTLVADTSALRATFDGIVASARQVNCPGNIQSPGPWRRNAAPQLVAGTVFCGFRGDVPIVAWTDDADLLVSSVDGAEAGPNLDLLYTWWRGHL